MNYPAISFILPWYKKLELFLLSLPYNSAIFSNDAEVVIAMDDFSDIVPLFDLVKHYRHVRFIVVVNPKSHEWRLPARAMNVGIRHAIGKHVAILSPETVLRLPSPDYLLQLCRDMQAGRTFYTGLLWNVDLCWKDGIASHLLMDYDKLPVTTIGYGSLLVATWAMEAIRGWDESRQYYGADDVDVRYRMMKLGFRCVIDPNIHAIHPCHDNPHRTSSGYQSPRIEAVAHDQPNWGKDFGSVAWDWKTK